MHGQIVQVPGASFRSEEHTSELQSLRHLVCRPPPISTLFPYTTLFRSVWFQSGLVHEPSAQALRDAGITVLDECIGCRRASMIPSVAPLAEHPSEEW